ncbi:MAG: penicillin-binding transpeptidase domain-containing protein [Nannocystaceae bacterium]
MSAPPRRLGGIGALFFIASLGAIAYYVQGQEIPEQRDVLRSSATVLAEPTQEQPQAALPWQDRLDLGEARLLALGGPQRAASPDEASPRDPVDPVDRADRADPADPADPRRAPQDPKAAAKAQDAAADAADPNHSRVVQELGDGTRILYTLDPVLQSSALEIFRSREVPFAAAVVLDVRDNSVLAMAGHSSMDPQVDPLEIVATPWAPAASTFKLVTAAALVKSKRANGKTKECFSGGLHGITDDLLTDNPTRDTRCESLASAIAHSHNVVMAKLAQRHLDSQTLLDAAKALGFERDLPFEFPIDRSPAHIPAEPRERAKVAAGFWQVDMSPIQGALMASVFARGGVFQAPHVIAQVLGPGGVDQTPPLPKSERTLPKEAARAVGEMMLGTTTEGTARSSFRDPKGTYFIPGIAVAGKTGSLTGKKSPALNYNWFIGYAPADNPEIAFAVLLANEPKWKIKAHYAARRLVQIWLERREAIAEQRSARLTSDGRVILPDAGAKAAPVVAVAEPPAKAAPAPADDRGGDEPAPSDMSEKPAARRADLDALPPVPGPVAKGQKPAPAAG